MRKEKQRVGRPATGQNTQTISVSVEKSVLRRSRKKHANLSQAVTELLAADLSK